MTSRILVAMAVCLVCRTVAQAQPASRLRTPSVLPISAISVTGNKTLNTDAIVAVTGLKLRETGGGVQFDAARDRLLESGYFDSVSYSYRQQDLGFSVAFTVIESKDVFPLRIEALPLTMDKLTQIVKAANPLFSGLLPATKRVLDATAAAVAQELPGLRVRATVVPTGPEKFAVQFQPAEGLPVIADVAFEGSIAIPVQDLHIAMVESGIGQVFSEAGVHALLDRIVRPMYEKLGYMRVSFPRITSQPAAKVKGLDVTVTVVEGPRFRLGSVGLRGPMAGNAARVVRMANLPDNEFLDYTAIAEGSTRIRDTLRGEGYLDVAVSADRSINDATKTVDAWFDVNPGELYKFGRLEVVGLGLDGEAAIRKLWAIKSGDAFPGGYPDHFVQVVKQDGFFDNLAGVTATPSINHQTHTVDVTLTFTGTPGTRRRTTP